MTSTVWDRLYEDGIDRMEQRFMEEEQAFSFQPDISEAQDACPGEDGEVFDRLYAEGLHQREQRLSRHQTHWQQFPYRPNNTTAYDGECWNRLYQDGMQTKERLTRRTREPTTESLTFKPRITPYFTKEGGGASIFERLYDEAKVKRETEERRRMELNEALRQQYGFRPTVASPALGRKDVHRELYEDAIHRKMRVEELVRKVQAERELEATSEAAPAPPRRGRQPTQEPEDEEPVGPFVPKINDVRGVASRYMLPKRKFEPLHAPSQPLDPLSRGRPPWISPLEATSMEMAERDRGSGAARRSRSVGAEVQLTGGYMGNVREQPVGHHGLRPVRSLSEEAGARRTRAKSAESYMRPTMSSALRSPMRSTPSPPSGRFQYVADAAADDSQLSHQGAHALDFNRGEQFQVRTSPTRPLAQPSLSGLRTWTSPSSDRSRDRVVGIEHIASPRGTSGSGSGLPVKWDAVVQSSVSRTVSRETRTIDLT